MKKKKKITVRFIQWFSNFTHKSSSFTLSVDRLERKNSIALSYSCLTTQIRTSHTSVRFSRTLQSYFLFPSTPSTNNAHFLFKSCVCKYSDGSFSIKKHSSVGFWKWDRQRREIDSDNMPLRRVRASFNLILFTCVLHRVYTEKYRPILLWHSAGNDLYFSFLFVISVTLLCVLFKVKHAVIKRENSITISSSQS